jgi:hypothetical protein
MDDATFRKIDLYFSEMVSLLIRAALRSTDPVGTEALKAAISCAAQLAGLVHGLQSIPVMPDRKTSTLWLLHHGFNSVVQQTLTGEKRIPIMPEDE